MEDEVHYVCLTFGLLLFLIFALSLLCTGFITKEKSVGEMFDQENTQYNMLLH